MVNNTYIQLNAEDRTYLSILKKEIRRIAKEEQFSKTKIDEIDIIVAELSSNLIKYADNGEILAGIAETAAGTAIEIISIDSGPGIPDVSKILNDGYSTSCTLGQGLGSINRLSDSFKIFSQPGWGTVSVARKFKNDFSPKTKFAYEISSLVVAKNGETVSGDNIVIIEKKGELMIMHADGLGHGVHAHEAVLKAEEIFRENESSSPVEIIRNLHNGMRKTRGAVITIIIFNFKQKRWTCCGVGNIGTLLMGDSQTQIYRPYNGIVGHNIPGNMNEQEYSFQDYDLVVNASDGLTSRWGKARYLHMRNFDSTLLAACLYKDFVRKTDDTSISICKIL